MYKIAIIGEAWGEAEEKEGRPFVGQAGRVLDGILDEAGISRDDCYVTNVINKRPPNNNFKVYYTKGKPTEELKAAYEILHNDLGRIKPNVIVVLGGEALKALTGLEGILDWRGSVLETPYGKVIPIIHPAALLRQWQFRPATVLDFKRVLKESGCPTVNCTVRDYHINPTYQEALSAISEARGQDVVAFDIETEGEEVSCIGLSWSLNKAICIPFKYRGREFYSNEERQEIWLKLCDLLEAPTPRKVGHNGIFDCEYLHYHGVDVKLHYDTMLMFHALYAEFPKGLDFLVSIYTDHPYYKDQRTIEDAVTHFRYNATDAALTFEIFTKLKSELEESGQVGFYQQFIHSLVEPLLAMQLRGVKFDQARRAEIRIEYEYKMAEIQKQLNEAVGYEINVNSVVQMRKWLYDELKLPKKEKRRKTTGETTVTADDEALNRLFLETANPALRLVLELRALQKIVSTYLRVKLDTDQRIRCSYTITGTETGRLSSRTTARGTGTNLQNIPSGPVKELFVADGGCVFINADLSQAEARVVAYLADEVRLIEVFNSGGDIHRKNAANIFKVNEGEVTDEQRNLAKRVVHASNYGMGWATFSRTTGIPAADAKRLLCQYFATYPRIEAWHRQTKLALQRSRVLTNPFGRRRVFFAKWDEQCFKEGLAFVPQSTVADVMNLGVVRMHNKKLELLLQVHDSVVVQAKHGEVDAVVRAVRECLAIPIEINRRTLLIPVDIKVGTNWNQLTKYQEKTNDANDTVLLER